MAVRCDREDAEEEAEEAPSPIAAGGQIGSRDQVAPSVRRSDDLSADRTAVSYRDGRSVDMDTIFSDYQLTASRFARLLASPAADHEELLAEWHRDDLRPAQRLSFYGLTHRAVGSLYRRDVTPQQVRAQADEWRLEASVNAASCERLTHNARATDQYLDHHGERELTILERQRLETCVDRIRVTASPHLYALCGAIPTRLWLDCTETFDEPLLIAKCYVTLWLSQRMRTPAASTEVIHSAQGRIVARDRLAKNFDSTAIAICGTVRRTWGRLGDRISPR
jgi:hypothetical protein